MAAVTRETSRDTSRANRDGGGKGGEGTAVAHPKVLGRPADGDVSRVDGRAVGHVSWPGRIM